MFRSAVRIRRLELFPLPPLESNVPPLHRYHEHDLLEWIVDNKVDFLRTLLLHWNIDTNSMCVEDTIREVALLLYGRVVTDTSSLGLRGIKDMPKMNSVTWKECKTWHYDTMRMETQHFRPKYKLSLIPDYRNSIDQLAMKLNLRFVHPCRYMNWIQYELERTDKYCWRFVHYNDSDKTNNSLVYSNYYDCLRSSLRDVGLHGNFTPLLSYGNLETWITYSIEELEESVRRDRLPLSISLPGVEFYEPRGGKVLDELYSFLHSLQGSIYTPFVIETYRVLHESRGLFINLTLPNVNIYELNVLAYRLRPEDKVDESVMGMFYHDDKIIEEDADNVPRGKEIFGDMKSFTRAPKFLELQAPMSSIYEKTFQGGMCCADFAEILMTTTQVYARKFNIEIEYTQEKMELLSKNRVAHIDYIARRQLDTRD